MSRRTIFWPQVKAGTIFDNFLITDDEAYAEEVGNETWGETKGPEKTMKDEVSVVSYCDSSACMSIMQCSEFTTFILLHIHTHSKMRRSVRMQRKLPRQWKKKQEKKMKKMMKQTILTILKITL